MSFVSLEFILLFSFVVPTYYFLPHRYRWILLLASSYFFYMSWRAEYVVLILFTTACDYFIARRIHSASTENSRRLYLSSSIFINLSFLFFFKYFNFFSKSLASIISIFHAGHRPITLNVLLPLGISFYTFQEMAYVIDVYRGTVEPETRFGIFALFVAFFPQLVAGPIERAGNMLPQYHRKIEFSYGDVVAGFQQILWGAFKKIVVADRLAAYVNEVYGNPKSYTGPTLIIATVFFSFQIYCDFSGYSDIAIGAARVLGFRLMQNFRQPYFALSIREFWQRWHIALSTWFRDYVYFPLAVRAKRVSALQNYINLVIVFVLSGLWHGANWTFVAWGALHGGYLVCEYSVRRLTNWAQPSTEWIPLVWSRKYVPNALRAGLTYVLICTAWVFFRANTLTDATYILKHFLIFPSGPWAITKPFGFVVDEFWLALAGILLVNFVDGIDSSFGLSEVISKSPFPVRWAVYYGLTAGILFFGAWGAQEFIYFQF